MLLTPTTRLGSYEIVGPLGAGGMGEVYRARDTRLGREVALKVLAADVASDAEHLARFEREARAVAALNHPNIVVLHSIEEHAGTRFLTMELVEGHTLADIVAPGGLPLAHVLELCVPLADALVAAHDKGIVHRDLKPANVMVTREGRVKVLDFGLAKQGPSALDLVATQASTMTSPLTTRGHVFGTVPYMAPEQIRGDTVGAGADVFALGVVLYELASGRRPFTGPTLADVSSAILRDTPPSLATLRPDLPDAFARLVAGCLEKQPRARFASAREVADALRVLAHGHGGQSLASRPDSQAVASVAVLPFVNRSASADDEYFAEGLADELLNVLAKVKGLRVPARTSAFQFKGRTEDTAEIARKLNVATILDGSVRKAGNRVRISVQLVNVRDGSALWSETYDRTLDDIFAVQDDIAQSVVKELRRTLLGEEPGEDPASEVARAARGRATDPEAYRLHLLGRYLIDRTTREDAAKGIGYLQQALERDPTFALAWAELGSAYAHQVTWGWAADGHALARAAAERALALEPDLAEGHAVLGWAQIRERDWHGADASFARALELAPGNALVLRRANALAFARGRIDEALRLSRTAAERDPLSAFAAHNLGMALHAAERYAEAEPALRKALELAPPRGITHAVLASTLLELGRRDEALAEATREPEEDLRLAMLAIVHHAMGDTAASDDALRRLTEGYADSAAYQIAETHAARSEVDAAFAWLERAHAQHDAGLSEVKLQKRFRPLHGDPRWQRLLKLTGFEG